MVGRDSDAEVVAFILDYIRSVEQLEVLLFLAARASEPWDAEAISRELRSSPRSIARWLDDLTGLKFLQEGEGGCFTFAPQKQHMIGQVRALAEFYSARRVTVIELIFNKPAAKLQTFADAFRLRGSKERG